MTDRSNLSIESEIFKMDSLRSDSLFMNAPVALCIFEGPLHTFKFVNSLYAKLISTDIQELVGRSFLDALPEIASQGIKAILDKTYQTGISYSGKDIAITLQQNHRSQNILYIDISCQAIRDTNGDIHGVFSVTTDVTEKHRAFSELRHAKEEAEKASALKSAFLANMSHEIRTPLSAMIGFADLLRDPELSKSERSNYIDVLIKNGQQLSFIINDILDISKVEAGHLRLEYLPTRPCQIAEDIISLFKVKAKEKNLSLELEIDPSTPAELTSDPVRVRQVLINLISNAIKFTQYGSVKIKSYALKLENNQNGVAFEVSDTGLGIKKGQDENLFEMFVQGDSSMTRRFGGTGLGLALSRKLAHALGGNVILKSSTPSMGSTFLFTFTDHPEHKISSFEVSDKRKDVPLNAIKSGPPLKDIRVLVVDDAPDNQLLIWHFLSKAGAQMECADNGLDGFKKALTGNYDLVLMDVQMPLMDGYTATKKLREHGYTKPIVALTAHAMSEVRNKCMTVGYTDHLTKPIDPRELVACIAGYTRQLH